MRKKRRNIPEGSQKRSYRFSFSSLRAYRSRPNYNRNIGSIPYFPKKTKSPSS